MLDQAELLLVLAVVRTEWDAVQHADALDALYAYRRLRWIPPPPPMHPMQWSWPGRPAHVV